MEDGLFGRERMCGTDPVGVDGMAADLKVKEKEGNRR
jgi:hypothetical protein